MANMELQKSIKNYQDKTRDKTAQFEAEQQAKVKDQNIRWESFCIL